MLVHGPRKYKKCIKHIKIHPDFDKKSIVKTFDKILTYELYILYSFNYNKKTYYKNKLQKFLREFNQTNPTFGQIK